MLQRTMTRPGVRILAKVGWVTLALCAAWLATRGMVAGFLELDPARNMKADRQARTLLTVAGFLFAPLATVGRVVFGAPTWAVLLLGGLAAACWLMTLTDLRFLAVPLLWPAVAGAVVGVVSGPPRAGLVPVAGRD